MLEKSLLTALDERMVDRYSTRLRQFGADPRTLGWDRRESQAARFAVAARAFPFAGLSVLDVGCGLADFNEFLCRDAGTVPSSYTGIDINPDLIGVCRQQFPASTFEVRNILREPYDAERWDVVTMFGLLNLRFTEFSNETYARDFISEAFRLSKQALVVDMLSAKTDAAYPPEDFVYYYQPAAMLDFALSLTPHVTLLHDYASIPQREFMLVLKKSPCA
jgi:ubiquinone/menaquinone biosynthesis C-methylase UbiE